MRRTGQSASVLSRSERLLVLDAGLRHAPRLGIAATAAPAGAVRGDRVADVDSRVFDDLDLGIVRVDDDRLPRRA